MDRLYAPWRSAYIARARGLHSEPERCVFCDIFNDEQTDEQRFILYKNDECAVLLNLYPYNAGHLLIIPRFHGDQLTQIPDMQLKKMQNMLTLAADVVQKALGATGVNLGMNIGSAAGAGIPDHLHWHIVPRFFGDSNFLTVVGNTKQISVDLNDIYNKLKPYFDKA